MIATHHTIIEGTDGTGKTTYAGRLSRETDRGYIHKGAPEPGRTWQDEYLTPVTSASEGMVLDRWHLGEMVWPVIFGRPSLFTSVQSFRICNQALWLAGVRELVVVVRDPNQIERTIRDRGEDQGLVNAALDGQALFLHIANLVNHLPVRVVHSDVLWRTPCTSKS